MLVIVGGSDEDGEPLRSAEVLEMPLGHLAAGRNTASAGAERWRAATLPPLLVGRWGCGVVAVANAATAPTVPTAPTAPTAAPTASPNPPNTTVIVVAGGRSGWDAGAVESSVEFLDVQWHSQEQHTPSTSSSGAEERLQWRPQWRPRWGPGWRPGPPLRTARCMAGCAVFGRLVFMAGGIGSGGQRLRSVEVLDLGSGRSRGSSAGLGRGQDTIAVAGGDGTSWVTLGAPMSAARAGCSAVVAPDGFLYVVGGEDGRRNLRSIERINATAAAAAALSGSGASADTPAPVSWETLVGGGGGSGGDEDAEDDVLERQRFGCSVLAL